MICLLSIIEGSSIKTVIIRIYWKEAEGVSWFNALWETYGEDIAAKYREHGFDIKYAPDDWVEDIEIHKI